MIGRQIGVYRVIAFVGAGGMGEVYRATDTRLKRTVALKVLPEAVATDAERLARFQREAEVLASLNHPNVAHVYGLEQDGGQTALVMEFVEGEDLGRRIARGPVPTDEALAIARRIAEALEAAHARDIVHRDLKPANVMVCPDGAVKVLDFGLAKAMAGPVGPDGSAGSDGSGQPPSASPTLSTPAMTRAGVILGTAAYMSPEQARGAPADERSDIWAFGCVLYEMLSGRAAFAAGTVPETLANVLRADVDFAPLPPGLPPTLRAFLVRCLQRDPKERVHHIADIRLALDGAFDAGAPAAPPPPLWRRALPIAAAAALAVVLTLVAMRALDRPAAPPLVTRLELALPRDQNFYFNGRHLLAISPDGRFVAYTAGLGLWLHPLDQLEATPVPGAELEARSPFFSSDGRSIGYYAAGELRRVSVTGGAPVSLTRAVNPWGASWTGAGIIYYGQGPDGIWKVPADGGPAEQVIALVPGEQAHGPHLLPDEEWMLFTLLPAGLGSWNRAQIVVQSLLTGERIVLINGGRDARYLPTGHLVYGLNGTILAVPFDAATRRLTGDAAPLVRDVFDAGTITGAVHFDVAANGSLAYAVRPGSALLRLMWVDRNGREEAIPAEPRPYSHPRLSPDGSRIAVEVNDPANTDIWVGDARRGTFTRLTQGDDVDTDPIWTRDGSAVVFSSVRGAEGLFLQPADGGGAARHLTDGAGGVRATGWTADGRLLYEELAGAEIRLIPPDGGSEGQRVALFDAPEYFNEMLPSISPDGRWLAYQSTESGEMEVYLRPFPDVTSFRRQVSDGGGFAPLWSADGRQIFYRSATNLMAVPIATTPRLELGTPIALFNLADYVLAGTRGVRYDAAPDGRFLLLKDTGGGGAEDRVVLVQNWFEELTRRVPAR